MFLQRIRISNTPARTIQNFFSKDQRVENRTQTCQHASYAHITWKRTTSQHSHSSAFPTKTKFYLDTKLVHTPHWTEPRAKREIHSAQPSVGGPHRTHRACVRALANTHSPMRNYSNSFRMKLITTLKISLILVPLKIQYKRS